MQWEQVPNRVKSLLSRWWPLLPAQVSRNSFLLLSLIPGSHDFHRANTKRWWDPARKTSRHQRIYLRESSMVHCFFSDSLLWMCMDSMENYNKKVINVWNNWKYLPSHYLKLTTTVHVAPKQNSLELHWIVASSGGHKWYCNSPYVFVILPWKILIS